MHPLVPGKPVDDVAVAGIVAFATQHGNPPGVRPRVAQRIERGLAGAFHQNDARDTMFIDCNRIEPA